VRPHAAIARSGSDRAQRSWMLSHRVGKLRGQQAVKRIRRRRDHYIVGAYSKKLVLAA
jgi:hypothetical protein